MLKSAWPRRAGFIAQERNMLRNIFNTSNDYTLTLLRLAAGVIYFAHGAQKLLGWFGGRGFSATMIGFTQHMHIPALLAFLVIAAEFFGGLGLIFGLLGRIAAFGIFCDMLVAVLLVHVHVGFFMNWSGTQRGEGYEFHLLALAATLAVVIRGSGALSIDRLLMRRKLSGAIMAEQPLIGRSAEFRG
jgi:putative oxidoreductase